MSGASRRIVVDTSVTERESWPSAMTHPSSAAPPRAVAADLRLWLSAFTIAPLLGVGVAIQGWLSYRGPNRPTSFWQPQYLQPQLIPWYMWALLTPLLAVVFE